MAPENGSNGNGDALKDAPQWFKLFWFAFSKGGLTFCLLIGVAAYAYTVAIPESQARSEALKQQGQINTRMVDAVEAMHVFMGDVKQCHEGQNRKLDTISVTSDEAVRKLEDLKRAVETARTGG